MIRKSWFVLLLFTAGTLALYYPVLWNGFFTDDYASLYRILVQKEIEHREMLRPWIDISFYSNYLFSGLNPFGYYVFNFAIHVLTCYMVYRVALRLRWFPDDRQYAFAWTAGILFLLYPFHNEGVIWLSGRLSSMAALFGLLAIYFYFGKRRPWNFILAAFCWIMGLLAYESIILLPLIILLMEAPEYYRDRLKLKRAVGAWFGAGIVYLLVRWTVAGTLFPGYGKGILANEKGNGFLIRTLKVLGRCFLPPMESSRTLMVLFALLVIVVAGVHVRGWRKNREQGQVRWGYGLLWGAFFVALVPAAAFGVSTRTSEGDRLLYFPSVFLCLLLSAGLFFFIEKRVIRLVLLVIIGAGSLLYINGNNRRWVFASQTAAGIFDTVKKAPGRVVLVNAPDEWEGAYIFRNNFNPSLVINGIDTGKVTVSHFLLRLEYLGAGEMIDPVKTDSGLFIYPVTRIVKDGERFRVIDLNTGAGQVYDRRTDALYYWDKIRLKRLILE
ncbi:MAG TPA: hypothetical protein VI233_02770 [Puia sp.]